MKQYIILFVGLLVVTVWPFRSVAEISPMEYVDHQYGFAFQFPADWKVEKNFPPGEAGETRAIIRHPTKPMRVAAMVGEIDSTITKHQFESNPNREAAIEAMIALSVEQVYKQASRDIGADRMIVAEKRIRPSNAGVKFYISTLHIKENLPILIAGTHVVPYEKPYMVIFMMTTLVDKSAEEDNKTIARVFNSFHIIGEKSYEQ
jgi:hypothetical protein